MTDRSSARHLEHVARGGAVGLAGSLVNALSGLALVILLARGLDPDVAGRFFVASSAILLLVAVCGLGTSTGLARFMLRYEAEGRHADVLRVLRLAAVPVVAVSLLVGAAVVLLAGPVAGLLGWEGDVVLVQVLAASLPFAVVTEVALAGTRAFGRMRTTAFVDRTVRAGLQPLLAAIVLAAGGGVVWVAVAWTAAWVLAALLAVVSLTRFLRRRLAGVDLGSDSVVPTERERRRALSAEFWSYTRWRGVARVTQVAIQRADVILVAAVLGPSEAAVYTAATRFVVLGQFVTQALQQVLQPRFTSILVEGDLDVLREVFRTGTAWSVALAWPVYLVIGCAPAVYLSVFGDAYDGAEAQAVVMLMVAAMLVAVAAGAVDTLLVMAGRSGLSVVNGVSALVVDVVGCLVLLPVLGVAGAAVAWGAAVLLRNGLAVVQVRRDLGVVASGPAVGLALVLPLLLVALPVGMTALFSGGLLSWGVSVATAAMLYVAGLYRFRRMLRIDVLVTALTRSLPGRTALDVEATPRSDEPAATASAQPGADGAPAPGRGLGAGHG